MPEEETVDANRSELPSFVLDLMKQLADPPADFKIVPPLHVVRCSTCASERRLTDYDLVGLMAFNGAGDVFLRRVDAASNGHRSDFQPWFESTIQCRNGHELDSSSEGNAEAAEMAARIGSHTIYLSPSPKPA